MSNGLVHWGIKANRPESVASLEHSTMSIFSFAHLSEAELHTEELLHATKCSPKNVAVDLALKKEREHRNAIAKWHAERKAAIEDRRKRIEACGNKCQGKEGKCRNSPLPANKCVLAMILCSACEGAQLDKLDRAFNLAMR